MPAFQLRHSTTYVFSSPVQLSPHTLYLRPRSDHKLTVQASFLTLSPPAEVVWRSDLYGNSIAIAYFNGTTTQLDIVSELSVETFPRSESQRRCSTSSLCSKAICPAGPPKLTKPSRIQKRQAGCREGGLTAGSSRSACP